MRSRSINASVGSGISVRLANSIRDIPCNSRTMRTDWPTETAMCFLAGRKSFTPSDSIVMGHHLYNRNSKNVSLHSIDYAPFATKARRPVVCPLPRRISSRKPEMARTPMGPLMRAISFHFSYRRKISAGTAPVITCWWTRRCSLISHITNYENVRRPQSRVQTAPT